MRERHVHGQPPLEISRLASPVLRQIDIPGVLGDHPARIRAETTAMGTGAGEAGAEFVLSV